jgi:hypothetical protein
MGASWIIGPYIPPETSRWEGWTDVEPLQKLWETVALCTQNEDKYVILLTDLNARTGSLQASTRGIEWAKRWARKSADPDEKINPRGRAAIQECERYGLCIVNGTSLETCSPGRLTSWQDKGESVIDYAIVSENALPLVRKFGVACPTPDPDDDCADNMRICLTVDAAMFKQAPLIPRERQGAPHFHGSEHIDELYQATMDAKQTTEDALK